MTAHPEISAYLDNLVATAQPNTVRTYRVALVHFAALLDARGMNLRSVTTQTVADFVAEQLAHPYAPRTVQIRLVALRTFGTGAVEQKVWSASHAQTVPSVADSYTSPPTCAARAIGSASNSWRWPSIGCPCRCCQTCDGSTGLGPNRP